MTASTNATAGRDKMTECDCQGVCKFPGTLHFHKIPDNSVGSEWNSAGTCSHGTSLGTHCTQCEFWPTTRQPSPENVKFVGEMARLSSLTSGREITIQADFLTPEERVLYDAFKNQTPTVIDFNGTKRHVNVTDFKKVDGETEKKLLHSVRGFGYMIKE